MINAIAIDDEPPALKIVENFCNKVDFITLQKAFTQPSEALRYLKNFPIDLLFLDIQMPSMLGIDFYKAVEQGTKVILRPRTVNTPLKVSTSMRLIIC